MIQTRISKFIFIILNFLCMSMAFAEVSYEFKSELLFKHEQSIVDGQLESYSLNENAQVKLLIGLLENKALLNETAKLSEAEIQKTFLDKESLLDPINGQHSRVLTGFQKKLKDNQLVIQLKYSLKKGELTWVEENTYVLDSKSTAFASIQFPSTLSLDEQAEIQKGLEHFKIIEGQKNETVFKTLLKKTKSAMSFFKENDFGLIFIDQSFAADMADKYKNCNSEAYIQPGEFTTKPGSAIFNFPKILSDIKEESIKIAGETKPDESKLSCLGHYYKEAKKKATDYWTQRGISEGCIVNEAFVTSPTPTCSDSTLREMNDSFTYLDNMDKELSLFMNETSTVEQYACIDQGIPASREELDQFKKLGATSQQSFCCASGENGSSDKGPLYKLLESESASFAGLSPATRAELCINKTIADPNKKLLSVNGFADCAKSMVEGLGNLIKSTIKAVASLFDLATLKALGQFVANLPSSGVDLIKTIGEHLATQFYSVNECMSPYESKQYFCKMIPDVAALLLGPGLIKTFAVKLVEKTSKTAMAQMIAKAVNESPKFEKLKAANLAAAKTAGRKISAVVGKRTVKTAGNLAKFLGKDVSTPVKEMVLGQAKKMGASGKATLVGSAQKVLNKPVDNVTPLKGDIDAFKEATDAGDIVKAAAIKEKMLKQSENLTNDERVKIAGLLTSNKTGAKAIDNQKIIAAHEVGRGEGRGYDTFTEEDIAKKARLLKEAGIDNAQDRRLLMESGVTGTRPIEEMNTAMQSVFAQRARTEGNTHQFKTYQKNFDTYYLKFKQSKLPSEQANYARLLGEVTQAYDQKLAKDFYQMGFLRLKEHLAKNPNDMNRDRNLENYVQLSARAGDQIEVKKSMEKQIAAEFNRDKDRYGWRQPAHAGIDRFDALDAEAEHYRKLGDKGLIDLAATRRKQRALLDIYGSIDTPGSGRAKRVDADLARLTDK